LKTNRHFTLHKDASLRRDEPDSETAFQKYRLFLDTHGGEASPDEELSQLHEIDHDFSTVADLITLEKPYSGTFYLSKREVCFNDSETKSVVFALADVEMVLWRTYLHIDSGIEFFLFSGRSYFLFFPKRDRAKILRKIHRTHGLTSLKLLQQKPSRSYVTAFTERWRTGQLSNYEYLMRLNLLAGRSFNDLSQYPVFPWIIADYTSENLNLDDPATFRDLSKPIGALNPDRLASLHDLFECDDSPWRCLYRMHYSNLGYVVHYLLRVEPFTTFHISLQSGRFDKAARLFWSVPRSWDSVVSTRPDFRELTPEFFTMPAFLVNANGFDLGQPEGEPGNVELPPWAGGSPHRFVAINRRALESSFVSANLHRWIDLIFGFTQQSLEAENLFHPHCYRFTHDHPPPTDPAELEIVQAHAANFGIVPGQLFAVAHPKRAVTRSPQRTLTVLSQLQLAPRALWPYRKGLLLLARDGTLAELPFPSGSRSSDVSMLGRLPSDWEGGAVAFASNATMSRLVTASQGCGFHVFALDQAGLTLQWTGRQRLLPVTALAAAGGSAVFATWGDASSTLWSLVGRDNRVYRRVLHAAPIVAVSVSPALHLVATVDRTKRCVLSMLASGKTVRSFSVDVEPVMRALLVPEGFLAIAGGPNRGSIRLYDLGGQSLAQMEFADAIEDWAAGDEVIAVVRELGKVVLLSTPELAVIAELPWDKRGAVVVAVPKTRAFAVCSRDGEVALIGSVESKSKEIAT
jgi:hypothetical protein